MKRFLANPSRWLIVVFLLATYVILMINLGRDALFDWDEGIYAELGRQILVTKNLFTTYWNGSPWLEKPPGVAWVSALGMIFGGVSSYGARLLMPLFAVYTLSVVYRLGSKLGSYRHGLIAAGVLASLNLFLSRTRAVNTDMPLLAAVATTVLFLLENRPAWWVALSIFGGVWLKGIAGLLSVIIALPLFFTKSKQYLVSLLVVSSLLIIPWHLYAYLKHGADFLTPYFYEQVLRRATAQIEFHFEPRWYYFTYLYENLGLGVLLVAALGALSLIHQIYSGSKTRWLYISLLWWVLAPLGIFTLAKTRLFWYILPIYPALALLISQIIGSFARTKVQQNVLLILALGILSQALLSAGRSIEIQKTSAPLPDRLAVVSELRSLQPQSLAVLVPPSERLSEALLPEIAKLSSSFRYGGMPSVVFYYRGQVEFFYDVDKFITFWNKASSPIALVERTDLQYLPPSYTIVSNTPTYVGIQKGVYALR